MAALALLACSSTERTEPTRSIQAAATATSVGAACLAGAESEWCWPYGLDSRGVDADQALTEAAWLAWRSAMVEARPDGTARIRWTPARQTVSEGMGYGMTLAALFDDQELFDDLTQFVLAFLDDNGLMHWQITCNPKSCSVSGNGGAPDAEDDMIYGLLLACQKEQHGAWAPSPEAVDYCGLAGTFIDNYKQFYVDHIGRGSTPGPFLMPGDVWCLDASGDGCFPDGIVNISYFDPGLFRAMGEFTGDEAFWDEVIARQYELIDIMQQPVAPPPTAAIGEAPPNPPGNCSGLVFQWNNYEGGCAGVSWQGEQSCQWYYDAPRTAWRIARDKYWYGSAEAIETVNEIGSFLASLPSTESFGPCTLDGECSSASEFHKPVDLTAIWAADTLSPVGCGTATGTLHLTNVPALYSALIEASTDADAKYYEGAWRLFGRLLMSGNLPHPLDAAPRVPPNCTDDADCDDENVCTDDSCNLDDGVCVHAPNTLGCNDGDPCTLDDACIGGECSGTPLDCSDSLACTTDSCDLATGECVHDDANCCTLDVDCGDGDLCTIDVCTDGACNHTPVDCSDGDLCTDDVCTDGQCSNPAVDCDDANACTADACVFGVCEHTLTCQGLRILFKKGLYRKTSHQPLFDLVNDGADIDLSRVTIRYYFTNETLDEMNAVCDAALVDCANVTLAFGAPASSSSLADTYLEVGFANVILPANSQTGEIRTRLHSVNFGTLDPSNDYSYTSDARSYTEVTNITVYVDGTLVWGVEPS